MELEGQHLLRARPSQHKLQTLCPKSLEPPWSCKRRNLVWNWTRIHSHQLIDKVHQTASRLAQQRIPRRLGTLLLLHRCQRFLRSRNFRRSLQSLSLRWNLNFRHQCWGHARTVGILSWTSPWNFYRRLTLGISLVTWPCCRGLQRRCLLRSQIVPRMEWFRLPHQLFH